MEKIRTIVRILQILFAALVLGPPARAADTHLSTCTGTAYGALSDSHPVVSGSVETLSRRITDLIHQIRSKSDDAPLEAARDQTLFDKVKAKVSRGEKIPFLLPAFPFKSQNSATKVLGSLPDLGEEIALQRISDLAARIREIYPPGVDFVIASDGRAFASGLVGVSDREADAYLAAVKALTKDPDVRWSTLDDFYPGQTPDEMRGSLIRDYGVTDEQLDLAIRNDPDKNRKYLGLVRFFEEDIPATPALSKSERSKRAKAIARDVMKRSEAYAALNAEAYPGSIRFSVHRPRQGTDKLGINLVSPEGADAGTPWHNVTVKFLDGRVRTMKRADAEAQGFVLVERAGRPYYFREVERVSDASAALRDFASAETVDPRKVIPRSLARYNPPTVFRYRFDAESLDQLNRLLHNRAVHPKVPELMAASVDRDLLAEAKPLIQWNPSKSAYVAINTGHHPPAEVMRRWRDGTLNQMKDEPGGVSLIHWYSHPWAVNDPKRIIGAKVSTLRTSMPLGPRAPPFPVTLLDLTARDLPYLKEVREMSLQYMTRNFGYNPDKDTVRFYFHFPYAPDTSVLHLHVRLNQQVLPLERARSFELEEVIGYLERGKPIRQLVLDRQAKLGGMMILDGTGMEVLQELPNGGPEAIPNPFFDPKLPSRDLGVVNEKRVPAR